MRVLSVRGRTGRSRHRLIRRIRCLMTYGRFCPHVRRFPACGAIVESAVTARVTSARLDGRHLSHEAAATLDTWFRSPSAHDPLVLADAVPDDDRVLAIG